MKQILIFVTALLIFSACTTPSANRGPASEPVPTHYIFLVHGITGDQTHFGAMKEALNVHLNRLNPQYRYDISPFDYDTKSDVKDVMDFANDINAKIMAHLKAKGFGPKDKISIVAHSQGGIVMSIWLFRLFTQVPGYGNGPESVNIRPDQMDSFVTLGTPFWGSKLATFVKSTLNWGSRFKVNFDPTGIYGNKQLLDMSFN
ncbi:MAG: hypothetical protein ABL958_16040, partial [Bdellovibrionia bacterium]